MTQQLRRIVVVGGGAGGLELATRLGKKLGKQKRAEITLVDAQRTHFWKPLLHEVAAGSLNAFEDELSYLAQAKWNHFHFLPGRMCGLDRDNKVITLEPICDEKGQEVVPSRELEYDDLVIAVGSTANDFNTLGAKEHCLFLDSRAEAEKIHTTLLNHYLHAQSAKKEAQELNISVIGAGATGVELSAELHNAAIELARYGLDAIKPNKVNITIIEGGERILPALPLRITSAVHKQLTELGVTIKTNQIVSEVTKEGLNTKDGSFIETDLCIWAAGIKAPEFLKELSGLETNRINQLVVRPTLQTTLDDSIYALGDCASCTLEDRKGQSITIPPRAQAAHQQAELLTKSLCAQALGGESMSFTYKDYGSLISLSRFTAIGNLMGAVTGDMMVEGALAKLFYISLYRMHQIALFGRVKTAALVLKDFISKTTRPHLKLH
ncbi:FAD-dependent oxidoreductase [Endozoicomonas sp. OPT23]|uniref:NAD(P)/FAD-dependent oxidoreductase n=1 Tax=Endozoicomonas sp. OPT23 TaxID=2072845 RepID=UPI00129BD029|nr:NAD(P)/FAD-dependent oxidoreductase [Endozoicomonas sp. OPT23]MRI32103.1 FAD-dependent oxidoreductase [Endozoicomonas sp. OPT23]